MGDQQKLISKMLPKRHWIFLISIMIMFFHSCTSPDLVHANIVNREELTKQLIVNGPAVIEMEKLENPERILERETGTYHLVSSEVKETLIEGVPTYVSAIISYELEGEQLPPETTTITLYDERTESSYNQQLPYQDMKENEVLWEKTFSFPIIISDYDADYFQLGEILISKDEELIRYADSILESMGLSEDDYRVDTIKWNGEAYEKDGGIFREAVAEGEKKIRCVDVTYGGEIKTPDVTGYQYVSTYILEEKKDEQTKDIEIKDDKDALNVPAALEQRVSMTEQILRYLREHITVVVISGGFLLIVIMVFCIWWRSKANTKNKKAGS